MSNRHARFPAEIVALSAPDLIHYACRALLRVMDTVQTAKDESAALTLPIEDMLGDLGTNAELPAARLRVLALERGSMELLLAAQAIAQECQMTRGILENYRAWRAQKIAAAKSGNLGGSPLL